MRGLDVSPPPFKNWQMKRKTFLMSLLGVVAAPFVAKEVLAKEEEKPYFNLTVLKRRGKEIGLLRKTSTVEERPMKAIEYHKIAEIGKPFGLTPKQVLDIYCQTGVLLYKS